ncbi:hypothetical protein ACROYT_G031766 [Oculina patagonica]
MANYVVIPKRHIGLLHVPLDWMLVPSQGDSTPPPRCGYGLKSSTGLRKSYKNHVKYRRQVFNGSSNSRNFNSEITNGGMVVVFVVTKTVCLLEQRQ